MAADALPFSGKNWIGLAVGLAVIALGYVLLSIPPADGVLSLTLAPLLLVLGYCGIIPYAILCKDPKSGGSADEDP